MMRPTALYGMGYVDPRLTQDSADYTTADVVSQMPRRRSLMDMAGIDPKADRDTILPFAQSPGQRTPPSQWNSTADVMRNADATRGGAWQLALPQFAVDAVKAVDAVGSSGLMTPYTRTDEAREAMTEHAGAIVGPQMAAGFMRNALARPGVSELGNAGGHLPPDAPGIRAYHGSPHDFDRFSLDKIGTGEGAQAYGHGLYFAENEAVAKGYRNALSNKGFRTSPDPVERAYDDIQYFGGNKEMALKSWRSLIDASGADSASGRAATEMIAAVESGAIDRFKPPGRLYEVRINADPDQFLDWDKPLSQQSEKVRGALDAAGVLSKLPDRSTGDQIHRALASRAVSALDPSERGTAATNQVAASKSMREAGIPGIKYLDQGSRGAGEGSRNYVVFDDSLISIVKKYMAAGMTMSAAIAAAQSGQAEAKGILP